VRIPHFPQELVFASSMDFGDAFLHSDRLAKFFQLSFSVHAGAISAG
jgi:hypothetical protein